MKKLVVLFSSVILFSCQNQKEFTKRNLTAKTESNLNEIENSIINDFLDIELKKSDTKDIKIMR